MTPRTPPNNASVALKRDQSNKLFSPSAARNVNAICSALKSVAPAAGNALEIASGTGQHIVSFAAAIPNILWHPTDVEASRITSIQSYIDDSLLPNIAKPILLNATQIGWSANIRPMVLISLSNLFHLISASEAKTLIGETAKTLAFQGTFFLYGPFKRGEKFTSQGDKNFDESLRASDPDIGYKDKNWIIQIAKENGLILDQAIEMPANNLALIFGKAG